MRVFSLTIRGRISSLFRKRLVLRNFVRLVRAVANWYEIPLYYLSIKRTLVLHFRRGICFLYVPDAFSVEHFLEEPYKMLVSRDKVVVDVGAYNGDSAIYFSQRGAKKVIAFEPFPFPYAIAKKNLELNQVSNIEIFNEAVGPRDGNVFIDSEARGPAASLEKTGKTRIRMRSLSSLVEQFKLSKAALKMDCEGSEVCLLEAEPNVITAFDQIIVEYHDEGYEQLNRKLLSCGYSTFFLDNTGKIAEEPLPRNGLIYACF